MLCVPRPQRSLQTALAFRDRDVVGACWRDLDIAEVIGVGVIRHPIAVHTGVLHATCVPIRVHGRCRGGLCDGSAEISDPDPVLPHSTLGQIHYVAFQLRLLSSQSCEVILDPGIWWAPGQVSTKIILRAQRKQSRPQSPKPSI